MIRTLLQAAALAALLPLGAIAQVATPAHRTAVEQAHLGVLERYHRAVWVDKDTASIPEFMTSDFFSHASPPNAPRGGEPVRDWLAGFFAAFPDLRSETLYNLVDGDRVVTAWTITATHRGEWYGVKPTGRAIKVTGIDVLRLRDGRFAEHWFGLGLVMPQIMQQIAAPKSN
jgi:predicted ester cyclase